MEFENEPQENDGTGDMIMSKNGLFYKMPQTLSTTVNRNFKREYAQRNQYKESDTIVFDWNTGSSYVDPSNAMLSFDVTISGTAVDATTVVGFGSGCGATALIEEIRIMSKNGAEVDRIQSANILAKIQSDWTYDTQGLEYLQMAMKGRSFDNTSGLTQKVVIPLKLISGFFRPVVRDMLIPSGLASGARIEITLARPSRALFKTAGAGTALTYTVNDPQMLLMLHDLNDPTSAVLMQNSAQSGLEYTFPSYFATTLNSLQTSIHEQVKKGVSQATRVYTTVFDVSGANAVGLETKDGFETLGSNQLVAYQYRVGSTFLPQNLVDDATEAWYIASSTFGKNRDTDLPSSVSFTGYNTGNKFIVGVPLQTHDRLNLSGLPINNSSVLELRLDLLNAGGLNREVVIFMEHISVARTFVNKTTIKI